MGVVILGGLLLLLVVVRNTLKMADAKTKLTDELSSRVDDWYIKTGTVSASDSADHLDARSRFRDELSFSRLVDCQVNTEFVRTCARALPYLAGHSPRLRPRP